MALTNFMGATSYTIIQRASYSKQERSMSLDVCVYTSAAKTTMVTRFQIDAFGAENYGYAVISRVLTAPPGSPTQGDAYIVASGATGDWSGLDNKVVVYNGASWDEAAWATEVHVTAESANLVWNGTAWTTDHHRLSAAQFDAIFGVDQIGGADNNILKTSYNYLKTRAEFAGAVDA